VKSLRRHTCAGVTASKCRKLIYMYNIKKFYLIMLIYGEKVDNRGGRGVRVYLLLLYIISVTVIIYVVVSNTNVFFKFQINKQKLIFAILYVLILSLVSFSKNNKRAHPQHTSFGGFDFRVSAFFIPR